MNKNFLLKCDKAKSLYDIAKELPIIDYHNHLSLTDIAENKRYYNIYDLWIKPDPYKHRAMRMCGVEEQYITGNKSEKEKFVKWCESFPKLIGNPLYHWSLMELSMIFGIEDIPNESNAVMIYDSCNDFMQRNEISVRTLLKKFNVEYFCPCSSLVDDISIFNNDEHMTPSLRGDDIVAITNDFIEKLCTVLGKEIKNLHDFKNAVIKRLVDFKKCGCAFTDHALDNGFEYYEDDSKNDIRFEKLLSGEIKEIDKKKLYSHILTFLGTTYSSLGFTMQLHIGAQRYTSERLRNEVGPAGGFAAIGNSVNISSLTNYLNELEKSEHGIPKIILFTLNPADNAIISVLSGSYSKDNVSGLITQGPAWWWCDHKSGILDVLENTAAFGLLSNFVGMTTDSRSFLSFVRHEYFRRILCNWLAEKVDNDDYIYADEEMKKLICRLCYGNAKSIMGGFKNEL